MENNRWGRRIRAFRKLKAMKQLDFAKQIGMSTSILGQIERGTRVPTQQQLDTMASVLNIEVEELMGETNS
ncbi:MULTISPECIES: helix-turn-helix domain-containing protein [Paenisporosarcina]|uniref:Helix-turn-helix domain-containing protein n=1 Tax=Paenisporosarcina quisquiliarum TaxID=365346 RepID=A0A9X3LIF4_9BACL|nr:helix-turn-helix transcriptional regulator [Paenisporosarcina quisquiliarum]MCZ8538528.1 helix-turn-helix domain-containing protein [Paenisporosarcina quisquiliarum]